MKPSSLSLLPPEGAPSGFGRPGATEWHSAASNATPARGR